MIEYLAGQLASKSPTEAVVDCGGVGYRLLISLNTYGRLPEGGAVKVLVHAHFAENDQRLYGFADEAERHLFRLLQGVRGVGPSLARALLSHESPERLIHSLKAGDVRGLTRIKGVGRKTAERLLVELSDRLGALEPRTEGGAPDLEEILVQALTRLGLADQEARDRARRALENAPADAEIEPLLRAALRNERGAGKAAG